MTASKGNSRLRLRVTAAAESMVRAGHPWVFSDSVRELNRDGRSGELGVIYDRNDKFLAVGLFDPDSPIRLRVLHAGKPQTIDRAWWSARLAQAVGRRHGLFDERTTGYRLINGESDGWPGLVLDRYDTTLVLKLYTGAWLPRLEEIVELIRTRLDPENLALRLSRNLERLSPTRRDGEWIFQKRARTENGGSIVFLETGLRFEADVLHGQKTGFFLDQRENRRQVESMARGRQVLNAFSFSGGFSLYAARGGALSTTDLDLSVHALESAKRNFSLNANHAGVAGCRREFVQADAFEWMAGRDRRKFDLIVIDPPSLARRESERSGAIRAYAKLVEQGAKHLSPQGILLACSCSAHVSADEFFGTARTAAAASRRKFAELQTTRHPPDHPAGFKEAEYLKAIYLRFD